MCWLLAIAAHAGPIRNIADIRALPSEEAAAGLPVELVATVTFADPVGREFFLQQEDGASISMWHPQPDFDLRSGDRVEIITQTAAGQFVARLEEKGARVTKLGVAPRPMIESLVFSDVVSGAHDCKLTTLDGLVVDVVRDGSRWRVDLRTAYGHTPVHISSLDALRPVDALRGDTVRVTGVVATQLTDSNAFAGLKLFAQSAEDIEILSSTPPTQVALSNILEYDPRRATVLGLVEVSGVVTARQNAQMFVIQDADRAALVSTDPDVVLQVELGDRVRLQGFPSQTDTRLELEHATLVDRSPGEPLAPADLGDPAKLGALALVRAEVEVISVLRRGEELIVVGSTPNGPMELRGRQNGNQEIIEGSRVATVGVYHPFMTVYGEHTGIIALDHNGRFVVLRHPPWWSQRSIVLALGGLLLLLTGLLGFAVFERRWLRLQVESRTINLTAANDALAAAETLRSQVVEAAVHAMFSPLTVISISATMLQERLKGEADRDIANDIVNASARLRSLITRRLRDRIHRLDALAQMPLELHALTTEAITSAGLRIRRRDQKVKTHLQPVTVQGDPEAVAGVIANLIDNACKYSPVGSEFTVEVWSDPTHGFVRVRDAGPGIPPKLTELLRSGDRDDASLAGDGLYLSALIVRCMGGDLTVEEEPGAVLLLTMPRTL